MVLRQPRSEFGLDHRVFDAQTVRVASCSSGWVDLCIPSVSEIQVSFVLTATTPTSPSIAPRSGTTVSSVARVKHMCSVSTWLMKRGARWHRMGDIQSAEHKERLRESLETMFAMRKVRVTHQ